jgi:hypothetical protein
VRIWSSTSIELCDVTVFVCKGLTGRHRLPGLRRRQADPDDSGQSSVPGHFVNSHKLTSSWPWPAGQHPAISVWSVAALPNGDIVTGASDFTARIFTREIGRVADGEVIAAYEEAVAENAKSPPVVDGSEAGRAKPPLLPSSPPANDAEMLRRLGSCFLPHPASYFKLSVDVADDRPPLELNYNTKGAAAFSSFWLARSLRF